MSQYIYDNDELIDTKNNIIIKYEDVIDVIVFTECFLLNYSKPKKWSFYLRNVRLKLLKLVEERLKELMVKC